MQRLDIGKRSIGKIVVKDTWALIKRKFHKNRPFSYYDALGITPKATQADIKKAFYKLSMEFHPDKQTGNEAKFKEISSAYEVLGNLKLRRLYDKGLLPAGVTDSRNVDVYDHEEVYPKRPPQKYPRDASSEQFESRRPPPSGRTDKYDFDAWTRAHYSDQFGPNSRRSQWINNNLRYQRARQVDRTAMERVVWMFACFVFSLAFYSSTVNDWDKPRRKPSRQTLDESDDV